MPKAKTSVIVLAAGMGTRMCSSSPKVMHSLAGRPMINHILETASEVGYENLILVIGPEMEKHNDLFLPYKTVVQKERLGTGHAVKIALDEMSCSSNNVIILYGDTPLITASSLNRLIGFLDSGADSALLAFRYNESNSYGRVFVNGDVVDRIVESSDASEEELNNSLCNSGIMAISGKKIVDIVNKIKNNNIKQEFYLTDIVSLLKEEGGRTVFYESSSEELIGINDKKDLSKAETIIQNKYRSKFMDKGVTLVDPSSVFFSFDTIIGRDVEIGPFNIFGPGVSIGSGVRIKSFCHFEHTTISDNCIIGPYARLRPGSVIDNNARIGNFVEIKNSKINEGAKVNHLSYIGDTNVGKESNIGAGVITANYDGFSKSKTKLGERVSIGSNSVLVAPVNIGNDSITGAGAIVRKDIPDNSISVTEGVQKTSQGVALKYKAQKKLKAKKNNKDS